MTRRCFYSFHYELDSWRAGQVRNIGVVEGNRPAGDNEWETVTRGGDQAIEQWIHRQMQGRSCTIVLIGSATAARKWITYEIIESWNAGMGVVGAYIHRLLDRNRQPTTKGRNPLDCVTHNSTQRPLSDIARAYDPSAQTSQLAYRIIAAHLSGWVEEAIRIRQNN